MSATARLLLGLAFLFVAGVAGGVLVVLTTADDLADVRLEDTRTALPGGRTVALQARRYNVLYEVPGSTEEDERIPVPRDLRVMVRARGNERALELRDYTGTFTTSSGGRSAQAIATIRPARDGRYVLSARLLEAPPRGATVVLGEPIGRRVVRLVAGALLVVLSGIGLLVVGVVALVRAVRSDPPGTGVVAP